MNGTAALDAALFVLGIKQGDEVICPSYTYWATAMPAVTLGAKVVFCEVDPKSLNMDPEDFRKKITPMTKAVIPVHLWGLPCEMDEIIAVARENKIAVIEDACHTHGAEYKGKKMGTLGDFGIFSFQASKNLPGGEGGMLITDNENYYYQAVTLGHYRRAADLPENYSKYQHTCLGFKHRMSPLHAAITRVQLKTLEKKNKILLLDDFDRSRVADRYRWKILEYAKSLFGNVLVIVDDVVELSEVTSVNMSDQMAGFHHYEIQPFGYKLRYELIKKWGGIGDDFELSSSGLIARVDHALFFFFF